MKRVTVVYQTVAALILTFVLAFTVRRACVQPIAHDEAWTFVWFLSGRTAAIFRFDPNNHFLFTLLAKASVRAFGVSEFSVRLPSLLGAAGYLTFCYLICAELFSGVLLPLVCALLALNPLVMEFLAAARGYSLGLGCVMGAAYFMVLLTKGQPFHAEDQRWRRLCRTISVLLALAAAANLSNAIAAFSLAACFAFVTFWPSLSTAGREHVPDGVSSHRGSSTPIAAFMRWMILPGLMAFIAALWPMLIQFRRRMFDFGRDHFGDFLRDTLTALFLSKWTSDTFADLSAQPLVPGSWQSRATFLAVFVFLPGLLVFLLVGLLVLLRTNPSDHATSTRLAILFAGSALIWLATIVLLHIVLRMKYPVSRACLFSVPAFVLGTALLWHEISVRYSMRWLQVAGVLLAIALVADDLMSLNSAFFRYNAYDSISRDLFKAVSQDASKRGLTQASVGGTWWYEHEWNFYRARYSDYRFSIYDIKDPSSPHWAPQSSLKPVDYDYFISAPKDNPDFSNLPAHVIYWNPERQVAVTQIDHPGPRQVPPCGQFVSPSPN